VIDEAKSANTGSDHIECERISQPATADAKYSGGADLLLSSGPNSTQNDLTGIARLMIQIQLQPHSQKKLTRRFRKVCVILRRNSRRMISRNERLCAMKKSGSSYRNSSKLVSQ
jgi:hypothetical protein